MKKFLIALLSTFVLVNAAEDNNIQKIIEPQIYSQIRIAQKFMDKNPVNMAGISSINNKNTPAAHRLNTWALKNSFIVGKNTSTRAFVPTIKKPVVLSEPQKIDAYKSRVVENYNKLLTNLWAAFSFLQLTVPKKEAMNPNEKLFDSFISSTQPRTQQEVEQLAIYKEFLADRDQYDGWGAHGQTRTQGVEKNEMANFLYNESKTIVTDRLINHQDDIVEACIPMFKNGKDNYFSSMRAAASEHDIRTPYSKSDRSLLEHPIMDFEHNLKIKLDKHKNDLLQVSNKKKNQDLHVSDLNDKDAAFEEKEKAFDKEVPTYIKKQTLITLGTLFAPTTDAQLFKKNYIESFKSWYKYLEKNAFDQKITDIQELDPKDPKSTILGDFEGHQAMIDYARIKYNQNNR